MSFGQLLRFILAVPGLGCSNERVNTSIGNRLGWVNYLTM